MNYSEILAATTVRHAVPTARAQAEQQCEQHWRGQAVPPDEKEQHVMQQAVRIAHTW